MADRPWRGRGESSRGHDSRPDSVSRESRIASQRGTVACDRRPEPATHDPPRSRTQRRAAPRVKNRLVRARQPGASGHSTVPAARRAAAPAVHQPVIGRQTVAEVPLTVLSLPHNRAGLWEVRIGATAPWLVLVAVTTAAAGRSARQITTQVVGAAEVLVAPGRQGKQHVVGRVPE
jgi:hypothetical protein